METIAFDAILTSVAIAVIGVLVWNKTQTSPRALKIKRRWCSNRVVNFEKSDAYNNLGKSQHAEFSRNGAVGLVG
jgi:hypothetical protein